MTENITKKWYPIIEKLDATSLLSEAERVDLCNYCEIFALQEMHLYTPVTHGMGPIDGNVAVNATQSASTLLPVMLRILMGVLPKLKEAKIPFSFSSKKEQEAELIIENGLVTFKRITDFLTHFVEIKLDKSVYNEIKSGLGITVLDNCHKLLTLKAIDSLFDYAKEQGEFILEIGSNTLTLISDPEFTPVMSLSLKVKKIKK